MKGTAEERLCEIAGRVPIMPQARETIEELKKGGSKIAIISSGLPSIVVNGFSSEIGADYAFGFEIGSNGGILNGEIWGDVIERDGKRKILSQILDAEKLNFSDCVVIVDDRNNVPMFQPSMLKIGYNPDFTVRMKADNVVTGNLSSILPVVMGKPPKPRLPSRNDLRREAIHMSAISIPFLVMLFGLNWVVFLISAIVSLYIVSEIARMEGKNLPLFSRITNLAASETELYEFATAPIYFALGILITLIVFPVPENSAAIAIFAAGDSSASLLGGLSTIRNPINKGKTLGGSIGGLVFAFLAGAVFIAPWKALVGAIIAMAVEALPSPLNDNITIPFSAALGITLLQ
jgi:phosphoserine phosphatase